MVDTLGEPTVFFTHSAADGQWPDLARLICPDNPESRSARSAAVSENPAIADWFFYHRICSFIDAFYTDVLKATDYWYRFEWQHRGSPHVHVLAWLPDAPHVKELLSAGDYDDVLSAHATITEYVDSLVSTINPAIAPDGSDLETAAPRPRANPHVCNKSYSEVQDFTLDLVDLIATCQRHTRCSTAYCLRKRKGTLECRFGYPKPLQAVTTVTTLEDGEPQVVTARNDDKLNSFNPVQLSAWRANVDMSYVCSRQKVTKYVAKYATKAEPRSKTLKELFGTIMKTLRNDGSALKVAQKLLISTVGERDYSAQETCHLLLQLHMYRASRTFVTLGLDGSREVAGELHESRSVTVDSQLDHYCARPANRHFESLTLVNFVQKYSAPKEVGKPPVLRRKEVIVIPRPYCSPDPKGPRYEQYCKQQLMKHKPFRQVDELLADHETYADAYRAFLEEDNDIPESLAEDIHRLEVAERENREANGDDEVCIHFSLHYLK